MSTVPGNDAWRDAGLVPVDPDAPARLTDPADEPELDALPERPDPEDHKPAVPRPDLADAANEADVVEQAAEVPIDDDEVQGE